MDSGRVARDTVRRVLTRGSVPALSDTVPAEWAIEPVDAGFNDVFVVGHDGTARPAVAVKFATFSEADDVRAGVAACRLLARFTSVPVPTVYAFEPDPADGPPFVVLEYRPGEPLATGYRDVSPGAARAVGAVVAACGRVPAAAADGYGMIRSLETAGESPRAVAAFEDWPTFALDYADRLYDEPATHDAIAAIAPAVPEYLREHRDRLPSEPAPAVVLTDFSPENIRTATGDPPAADADPMEAITGVLDLERARLAPRAFMAVNAEYLLTRYLSDPGPVRRALYEPLPFGPDVPARDLYRLLALGRSVGALPIWYEPGSEEYERRGAAVAAEIEAVLDR
ncbi:phosphotransferase family protein [Halovivax limisalsi]|uniref:phosphotransferase family protein n=1 Tax=Halovivax limisalsi TaxID=1453760 RepID=UPI001FFDBD93|nr:aminoglycoside phosphotransferase family protein [Halovivax limisalsi]